jgi:mono/diheme cytochrome c family protein
MHRPTLRFVLALVIGVTGVVAWNLWSDRGETSFSGADLPMLPPDLAPVPMVEVVVPASLTELEAEGERSFIALCAACHGMNAAGRDGMAPPLVHPIYRPRHHADEAFHIAVRHGVRAHHWRFGDMPRIEDVTRTEVDNIIAYFRALQSANQIE